ncbi:hypothetical protein AB0H43_20355 [Hamadaea sp. NPDC050747]|uniref:hypothetical protein n=1 Tax=Hamadaea sp. NPDC050747 TaxID=3155789 RepID=UPI0033C947DB
MERVAVVPEVVAAGPILRWLDPIFLAMAGQVRIGAGTFLDGQWPPFDCTPELLRAELESRSDEKRATDALWSAVVDRARLPGEAGRVWRLLALGLAVKALRRIDRTLPAENAYERDDVHADLVEGFLARLARIDTSRPNVAARLVNGAHYHARKGRKARRSHVPAEAALALPDPGAMPDGDPRNLTDALDAVASAVTAAGHRLDRLGLELIARTLLDGQDLADAATDLGLTVAAAYKRRRRTEDTIAVVCRIRVRRPASGRPTAVHRDATAAGA